MSLTDVTHTDHLPEVPGSIAAREQTPNSEVYESFPVKQILRESADDYLVEWNQINPKTREPWPSSWEPKAGVPENVVAKWDAKKVVNPIAQSSSSKAPQAAPAASTAAPAVQAPQNTNGQVGEQEPPDAKKIRGQVEYYFSDQNLRTDLHLLQCCGGRKNDPVSVSRICGWRKMRQWKKKDVVAALRNSKTLDLVENDKKIKRKVPLAGKCLLDEDFTKETEDAEIAYDPRSKRAIQHPVKQLPQDKKEHPPGMSKNMLKPTGFEDNFVEGPITPKEAEEELFMYHPDKAFVDRIEIAIQRFKSNRRMHEMYSKIFNKFMKFGGVESEPRQYQGLSQHDMKSMTSEEIARATATHQVPWDRQEEDKWVIDFVGVGEAFLSSYLPAQYGCDPKQVKVACQVLRSFYNYLLFHQVCDEYRNDLLVARALCDKAERELPLTGKARDVLPGPFQTAASCLFGGFYADTYTVNEAWAADLGEIEKENSYSIGMSNEDAQIVFKTGVAVMGTEDQYSALDFGKEGVANKPMPQLSVARKEFVGLQVVSTHPSTPEIQEAYKFQSEAYKEKKPNLTLEPLGKLVCKTWRLPDFREYDLPPGKQPPSFPHDESMTYEFWLEDDALEECFVGMKIDATVFHLSNGMLLLDEAKQIFCSFFRLLPNELWEQRKQPRFRLMHREIPRYAAIPTEEGEGAQMAAGEMSDDDME